MKRFKFTLVAASYSGPGIECAAPFWVIIPADDPRIEHFRNASFKEEPVDDGSTPAPAVESTPASPDPPVGDLAPLKKVLKDIINPPVLEALEQAGYVYAQDVLSEEDAGAALQQIPEIGKATATKIVTACEQVTE